MSQVHDLRIQGMSCGHCVKAVKSALEQVPGVERADVEIGSAHVVCDPRVDPDALASALREAGYELG